MLEQPPDIRPAPPGAWDRLNTDKIETGIAARMSAPDLDELPPGRIRWMLEPFDDIGLGRMTVSTVDGKVVGEGFVHWSALVDEFHLQRSGTLTGAPVSFPAELAF